jgi:hypothetical protein
LWPAGPADHTSCDYISNKVFERWLPPQQSITEDEFEESMGCMYLKVRNKDDDNNKQTKNNNF